jgi:hypothetical protein
VGTGVWSSVQQTAKACIKQTAKITPGKKSAAAYEPYYRTYGKLYFDLKERFEEMAKLAGK